MENNGNNEILEILVANPAIRNLIKEDKTFQIPSTIYSSTKDGMQTKDQSLFELAKKGLVDKEVAEKYAENPKLFTDL